MAALCSEAVCQIFQKIRQIRGAQTSVAVAAGFFLVRENRHCGVYRCFAVQQSTKCRISTNAVVMTIAADHTAVKSQFSNRKCRNGFQFCRQEIGFGHAVFFMQNVQDIQLDLFALLVLVERHRTYQQVQFFAADNFRCRTLHLLRCQMRQQVGHTEYRITGIFPDVYLYRSTVSLYHNTVQGQRNRSPLILLDTAIVVGLEHCQFMILIQRILLHIQTRRIDMCRTKTHTFCNRCSTDHCCNDRLAAVVDIDLIPCLQLHIRCERHKALFIQQCSCILGCFTFCLGRVQKCHVVRCKRIALLLCFRRNADRTVLRLHEKLFFFPFCLCFFRFHLKSLQFLNIFRIPEYETHFYTNAPYSVS